VSKSLADTCRLPWISSPTWCSIRSSPRADMERERGVILKRSRSIEDNPEVLVHELFTQAFWKDHPLGWPILGTTKTVSQLDQEKLFAYHGDRFTAATSSFQRPATWSTTSLAEEVAGKFSSTGRWRNAA